MPRGFYCASSPVNEAAGFCVREKDECARTRAVVLAGVADLGECVLTETAWCTDDRCAPTREGCVVRDDGDCAETK